MLIAHDSVNKGGNMPVEQVAAERLMSELRCVAQEHVDVSSDEGTGGFSLFVCQEQDHDLHLLHHARFIKEPHVTLRPQDIARLKQHMRKHEVAKAERQVMGLERAFDAAFAATMYA